MTTRGGIAESVHHGSIAIVDLAGRVLYAAGDPQRVTFARSTLKPFQALPFVAAGGIARFGLTGPETALLCASHSGEPVHVAAAASILAKAGNVPEDLRCGTQAPGFYEAHGDVPPPPPYSQLTHNCSGKHAGMLAHCVACGYDKSTYLDATHPLQREVRSAVAALAGVDAAAMPMGTDGCSLPNFALPLARLALAYARLAAMQPIAGYGDAPAVLARAMAAYPEMVSGTGRGDLILAGAGRGQWIVKVGAEAVQAVGIASLGVGIAIKVDDGARRALLPVTIATLAQAGCLDGPARDALAAHAVPAIRNARNIVTGEIRPVFVLDKRAEPRGACGVPAAPNGSRQAALAGK